MCADNKSNERSSGWYRRRWENILKSCLYRTGQSNWWVPTVMSRGDQSIRSCWALATTFPGWQTEVWCVSVCGCGLVFTSVCVVRLVTSPIKSVSSVFPSCVCELPDHTHSSDLLCTLKTKAEPFSSREWQIHWWPHEFIITISHKHARHMLT